MELILWLALAAVIALLIWQAVDAWRCGGYGELAERNAAEFERITYALATKEIADHAALSWRERQRHTRG